MRIVLVGPVPPIAGGIAQYNARVVDALHALGHDVDVRSWSSQYPKLLRKGQQRALESDDFDGADETLRWWDVASWRRVGRDAEAADLLVFSWTHPAQGIALRSILRASRPTPAVAIVHNVVPHEQFPLARTLARSTLRRANGAVVQSDVARDELRTLLPELRAVVALHPPNLDVAMTPLPPRPPLRVLTLGYVRPYKGLDVLIDAVGLVPRGSVLVTIAGEFWDPPVETWRDRLAATGLGEVITLRPGYVPDGEVGSLLADHHVVALPYKSATQSGVVPLAHAAGRPVVTSAVGGLVSQVRNGVDGLLVPPCDASELANALQAADRRLEQLAAGTAGAVPSWERVANAVVDLVDVDRSPPGSSG